MKRIAYAMEVFALLLAALPVRVLRTLGWRPRRVAIIGWWGSETVGDVAILGQLLQECRDAAPRIPLSLVSFNTEITGRTLRELGGPAVALVPVGVVSAWAIAASRCLVIGGGPLMESPSMFAWAWSARLARLAGAKVLCYANGIGPVRSARAACAVTSLVRSATHIVLRDDASRAWLEAHDPTLRPTISFDPAFHFVRNRAGRLVPQRRRQLALALRAPPPAYLGDLDAGRATNAFIECVAASLNALMRNHDVTLVGIVMHDGTGDSNDHALYVELRRHLEKPELLAVRGGHHTVEDAISDLSESAGALTVRFHAMILALATGTPFVAVDYARPHGKISAAAAAVGRDRDVISWDDLRSDDLAIRLETLLRAVPAEVPDLEQERLRRVRVLGEALC